MRAVAKDEKESLTLWSRLSPLRLLKQVCLIKQCESNNSWRAKLIKGLAESRKIFYMNENLK